MREKKIKNEKKDRQVSVYGGVRKEVSKSAKEIC